MKKILTLLLVTLWLPCLGYALPSISSLEGTVARGAQVVLRGTDFSTWNSSNILMWNDFESDASGNYTLGNEIPASPKAGTWHKFSTQDNTWTISALVNNSYSVSGSQAMWGHRGQRDWSGASVYVDLLRDLYVSYWFRFNHQGAGQVKLMQVKGNQLGSCPDYHPQVSTGDASAEWWTSYIALDENHGAYGDGCQVTDPYNSAYPNPPSADAWHFFEANLKQSDPDVSNGLVEIRVDGIRQYYAPNVRTRVRPESRWTVVQMLNGMTNYSSSNTWIDDMYVANSFSRVLLCNASTYQSSSTCHVQVASSWTDTSITFAVNQGNFASGQSRFVYVVNSSGTMNANGFPVTIGGSGSGDTLAPAAPTGLTAH